MTTALDGITVVDVTQGKAGALAGMLLCDNGARVIRLELPDGDSSRSGPGYIIWDRGKESVSLDIEKDRETFHKLVSVADVLLESFTPSDRYQNAVDYETLRGINPRLIHCSITAYGKRGPLRDEPPNDDLVMARTGILSSQPGFREGPVHVIHPIPSTGAATLAVQGIVAALYDRERTGRGRSVETSLYAGALLYAPKVVGEHLTPRSFQLTPAGGGPFYSNFECADGEWIQIGCIHGGFVDLAAAVMGIAEVLTDPRYGDGRRPVDEEARQELFDIVAGVIKTKPVADWEEIFESADVPYARAGTNEESMDNPQVIANDMVVEMQDPKEGRVVQMGVPIKMSETPGEIRGPRHLHREDTNTVLAELQNATPKIADEPGSESSTLPLAGVRVLEMTNVIAGPAAGKCLADLGADVIKLESLDGDISRPAGMTYFLYLNSNKRSVSVNTKTPEGMEAARRLAASSDIMLANMRPGATDRMGLSSEVMDKLNPGMIHAHTTAFGWTGPYSHRPGVDPLAQAWMGLQRAQGGEDNPPVFLAQLAPTDFTSGALTALGAILALYVRERTGKSQMVDCNLLNAGAMLSEDGFLRYEGKRPRRLADKGQHGLHALSRLYETKEGWLYVVAEGQSSWEALCKAVDDGGVLSDGRFVSAELRAENDGALADALSDIFAERTAAEWLPVLRSAGVPASESIDQYNVGYFDDEHPAAEDMVSFYAHPVLGKMKYSSNGLRFGNTEKMAGMRTPLLGEHNRDALGEVGYSADELQVLYDKGVIFTEDPSENTS
ncbi:MAG: CoA transferase [Chloroflexi bacterium]|nr:CoA transferase [Chloroflexota bacterium]